MSPLAAKSAKSLSCSINRDLALDRQTKPHTFCSAICFPQTFILALASASLPNYKAPSRKAEKGADGRRSFGSASGSGRLIAPTEGLNVRSSLDGARIRVRKGKFDFNATAVRPVATKPGIFDDVPDHMQTFWGAGIVMPRPFWKIANISAYYIGFDHKNSIFAKGAGREIWETFGAQVWKRGGSWDYDDEGHVQNGSFSGVPIRAWALASDGGHTFNHALLHPRLGIRADATSGDKGAGHRALGSFDPLFSPAPVWSGPSALLGGINLIDVTPSIRVKFAPSLGFTAHRRRLPKRDRHSAIPVSLG
jgi:hypothetical protein